MSFISYAQNHEDVMLYRALREVKEGFYIDVGAQDPIIDSVTKAFYERGWRGINIEPNEEYFRKLQAERPHDINLLTAVGREPGVISFYEVVHTGLSTINAEYARRHAEAGYQVHSRNVPCTTLDRICTDCGVDTVHFLKIDAEGSERAVLEGFSFEKIRPWVVVVEATEPNSEHEVSAEWENLIVSRRYRFVYFDGLNRFYIADEHADLARHFSSPPNPFDQYVGYHLWRTHGELEQVQAAERNALVNSLNHMLAEVQSLRKQLDEANGSLAATERRLRSIRSSVSWRLTRPLREIRRAAVRIGVFVRGLLADEDSSQGPNSAQGPSDQIAAGLTEPARSVYRALRATLARRS
jgi:FkbM family methyltransferase